jgi:hypothetical protein
VGLTYYSLTYSDPVQLGLVQLLDKTIAKTTRAFGGLVANGLYAFRGTSELFGGSPCAAGLLVPTPPGCNIHPSWAGHSLLAQAILEALAG